MNFADDENYRRPIVTSFLDDWKDLRFLVVDEFVKAYLRDFWLEYFLIFSRRLRILLGGTSDAVFLTDVKASGLEGKKPPCPN